MLVVHSTMAAAKGEAMPMRTSGSWKLAVSSATIRSVSRAFMNARPSILPRAIVTIGRGQAVVASSMSRTMAMR